MSGPRFCLLRLSALGDVCLCVPVVRTLQQAFPDARISWVISRPAHELVEGLDGVEFIVIDKPRSLRDYLQVYRQLRDRRFDVLLAMQASLRANLIYSLIKAPVKIGFDKTRARDAQALFTNRQIAFAREHLLDSFLRFAAEAGATQAVIDWSIPVGQADRDWAARQVEAQRRLLVVNACASKAERDWPVERFVAVMQYARERYNIDIVLTGGPSAQERAVAAKLCAAVPDAINLVGQTGMKQLLALLERADALLAPDTGPVHLARAVNTPVIGLYAVAPAWLTGPYEAQQHCVDHYDDAVREILGKQPEQVAWKTRVHDPRAMQMITVDEVKAQLDNVLAEAG
jgi:heptosyltransferase I